MFRIESGFADHYRILLCNLIAKILLRENYTMFGGVMARAMKQAMGLSHGRWHINARYQFTAGWTEMGHRERREGVGSKIGAFSAVVDCYNQLPQN